MKEVNDNLLIGPFTQLLTMSALPENGPLADSQLEIVHDAAIIVDKDKIIAVGPYNDLKSQCKLARKIDQPAVAIPGLIDSHTHICFAGSRASEYAMRVSGCTYQEIARKGGGILDTVAKTRAATKQELTILLLERCRRLAELGVTTCEVKSGYGLTVEDELKILEVIQAVNERQKVDLIPTCLAAHTRPPEFSNNRDYLDNIVNNLWPKLKSKNLCRRMDIFIDETAFSIDDARTYLSEARSQSFDLCIHADQFHRGGALLAAEMGVVSADHLEVSIEEDFIALKNSETRAIALPGCSLGLGIPQPHVRKMLDLGLCVAIASDWNPGSAPMGNLLAQAAILGAAERLTMAETLAGITCRAAKALGLNDRGRLEAGMRNDITIFPCADYREILYHQGSLYPILAVTTFENEPVPENY